MDARWRSWPIRPLRHWWQLAFLIPGLLAAATLLFLLDPAHGGLYPPCPFRALTGLYCPGCGTLRALHQFLHGQILAAFALNPLAVMALPFLAYAFFDHGLAVAAGRRLPRVFVPAPLIWAMLVVIICFGVLRNIPALPFSLLAP